jgi:hypothetical protein
MRRNINPLQLALSVAMLFIAGAVLLACGSQPSNAGPEGNASRESAVEEDEDVRSINAFLDTFQTEYSNRDIEGVSALFMSGGKVVTDFEGRVRTYDVENWLEMTGSIFDNYSHLSDRLTEREITVYGNIAVAKCRYDFDSSFEKSYGHDIFSLVRRSEGWLIVSLMYSGQEK